MNKEKKIKIILGCFYFLIITIFLWFFFQKFSFQDFSSYKLIRQNRDALEELKNANIILSGILFFFATIIWVLLLGFGSPILLISGFLFGKWLGTLIAIFGLTIGATIIYIFANFFFKDLIYKKFSQRFSNLTQKFKKNEFTFFLIYRFIGGIPFAIANVLPVLFNVKIRNYFFGSFLGMAPQIFIGTSLGAGLNKILENNSDIPNFKELILTPDIYLPILGLLIFVFIGFFFKNKLFKEDTGASTQN